MNLKKIVPPVCFAVAIATLFTACSQNSSTTKVSVKAPEKKAAEIKKTEAAKKAVDSVAAAPKSVTYPPINHAQYDTLMKKLARGDSSGKWPVKNAPYPLPGAILPYKRIVAFYGNTSSKGMGILGELPPNEMLAKLKGEVKNWEKADPSTPVQPALHYIAVVASGTPGKTGKYRTRMPFKRIDTLLMFAKRANAIVFLDVQVGLGSIRAELPEFEKYLAMPQVNFGMDPEFSMKDGSHPGKKIGTYDADDINYVSNQAGNKVQTLAEASYDAWVKYYRPNENSVNTNISYYNKGSIMALMFDLEIINDTHGKYCLDDVMKYMYDTFYKTQKRGYTDHEFKQGLEKFSGKNLDDFYKKYISGLADIDYDKYLSYAGYYLTYELAGNNDPALGVNTSSTNNKIVVTNVMRGTAAWIDGINAGDEITAIDGNKVTDMSTALNGKKPGDKISVSVLRDNLPVTLNVTLLKKTQVKYKIESVAAPTVQQLEVRKKWLRL